jgi:ABC-type multidrug transport system fused ATPase/permease subunit
MIIYTFYSPEILRERSNFWSLMVLVLAIVSCICRFAQGALFGRAGERLVGRLRVKALTNILSQRMEFFDRPENDIGRCICYNKIDIGKYSTFRLSYRHIDQNISSGSGSCTAYPY